MLQLGNQHRKGLDVGKPHLLGAAMCLVSGVESEPGYALWATNSHTHHTYTHHTQHHNIRTYHTFTRTQAMHSLTLHTSTHITHTSHTVHALTHTHMHRGTSTSLKPNNLSSVEAAQTLATRVHR